MQQIKDFVKLQPNLCKKGKRGQGEIHINFGSRTQKVQGKKKKSHFIEVKINFWSMILRKIIDTVFPILCPFILPSPISGDAWVEISAPISTWG